MWVNEPIFFEGEDEEQLKTDFIIASARYPNHDPLTIVTFIFEKAGCIDTGLRAQQAAMIWLKDLAVLERIRLAKLNGGEESLSSVESTEAKLKKLEAIYNDSSEKTADRLKAMELHAQIRGEIKKQVEKKVETSAPKRQIIFAQYRD